VVLVFVLIYKQMNHPFVYGDRDPTYSKGRMSELLAIALMLLGVFVAFFLGIIPEGFGQALLLGGILGVLLGIYHKLHEIEKVLSSRNGASDSKDL